MSPFLLRPLFFSPIDRLRERPVCLLQRPLDSRSVLGMIVQYRFDEPLDVCANKAVEQRIEGMRDARELKLRIIYSVPVRG